jgi:hypothetical protein
MLAVCQGGQTIYRNDSGSPLTIETTVARAKSVGAESLRLEPGRCASFDLRGRVTSCSNCFTKFGSKLAIDVAE